MYGNLSCCISVPRKKFEGSIEFETWKIVWRKLKGRHNDTITNSIFFLNLDINLPRAHVYVTMGSKCSLLKSLRSCMLSALSAIGNKWSLSRFYSQCFNSWQFLGCVVNILALSAGPGCRKYFFLYNKIAITGENNDPYPYFFHPK